MKCCKINGNIFNYKEINKKLENVDFDWFELNKRLHVKCSDNGTEIGIQLDENVLKNGLKAGDILFEDDERILCVRIIPCEIIEIKIRSINEAIRISYEIGNCHASVFYDKEKNILVTPFTITIYDWLSNNNFMVELKTDVINVSQKINTNIVHHHKD